MARGLTLLAGDQGGPGSQDGSQDGASFLMPSGLSLDGSGNLIVADTDNSTIRRIAPGGQVTTLAGQAGQTGCQDGPGFAARFKFPGGVAFDRSSGVIYVADTGNSCLRAIAPDGQVTTVAGAGGSAGAVDGTSASARFDHPQGVAVGRDGLVYVADTNNQTLRQFSRQDDSVTTLAGVAGIRGFANGPAATAHFASPWALAVDDQQTVYVADTGNHAIRRLSKGTVTTLAGDPGRSGYQDGDIQEARFRLPMGILLQDDGTLLVCDSGNGRIRTLKADTVGTYGATSPPVAAPIHPFKAPEGLVMDAAGTVFVADTGNSAIRQVAKDGTVTPYAGTPWAAGAPGGDQDFTGAAKVVVSPVTGIALVAYRDNGRLHRISPEGKLEALGDRSLLGKAGVAPMGVAGLAVDGANNLYVANGEGRNILERTAEGQVTTLAGPRPQKEDDGEPAGEDPFSRPADLAVDSVGNVFVTDAFKACVTRIGRNGAVTSFAGTPGSSGIRDGGGADAQFRVPAGIAVDREDNLFVADRGAHTIRRISPMGYVTTLAGRAGVSGSEDGDGANARFNDPQGVAVDALGNLFVADTGNATVRKITPEGLVSTVAGVAGQAGGGMGPLPGRLTAPSSVAVTLAGDLLVLCGNGIVQITNP